MAANKNKEEDFDVKMLNTVFDEMESKTGIKFDTLKNRNDKDLRNIFSKISGNQEYVNMFANIYFRIAYRVISSKVWDNPLEFLFKEQNYGIGVEEVFVNIAKPLAYDAFGEGEEVWKRVMPDVRNMLHVLNVMTYVQQTVYDEGLRTSFTGFDEWTNFRDSLVSSISSGLSKIMYQAVIYIIALYIIDSSVTTVNVANYENDPKTATKALQIASDKFTFLTSEYNPAGVQNFSPKSDQYLFVSPEFNATQNVDVLSYMFQVEKGELPQRKILVDSFNNFDYDALNQMFVGGVPKVFTEEEIEMLSKVPAFLCDKNAIFVYKLFDRWTAPFNDLKLYWNYRHHWQGTFSMSPFANAVALYTGETKEPKGILNPYGTAEIKEGRDNLFYVKDAYTYGAFSGNKQKASVEVSGECLIPWDNHPGWYHVANQKGKTATITYSHGNLEHVTITVTSV